MPSDTLLEFRSEVSLLYEVLLANTELDVAAALLTMLAMKYPELCADASFGASDMLRDFARGIAQKLGDVDAAKLS